MPPVDGPRNRPTHWRSPAELAGSDAFLRFAENEFAELLPDGLSPVARRRFLQLMGASMALAGAGCSNVEPGWPRYQKANILPEAYRPPGEDPGKPLHYATAMELAGVARPLLAKSYDGRPIKVEGNPEHPGSLGGADAVSQASVLELYDPDRSRGACRFSGGRATESTWEGLQADLEPVLAGLRRTSGQGLAILTEASSSPAMIRLRARLTRTYPGARWYEWEPLSRDAEREGARAVFARSVRSHHRLDRARVIVSLEDDFLADHPAAVAWARAFAGGRRAENGEMSRLYVLESAYSITGSQADHRHALPSGAVTQAAWVLAALLVEETGVRLPDEMAYLDGPLSAARRHADAYPFLAPTARDLAANRGHGLITCGPGQPAGVHALVHVLNAALGNAGETVTYTTDPAADRPSHVEALAQLVGELQRGRVRALIVLGGNPVYDAPADLAFAEALAKAERSLHLSLHRNETSRACTWHAPRAHYLESWADACSWDGTYTLTQPLIAPLFGGRTAPELLSFLLEDAPEDGQSLVRAAFEERHGAGAWRRAVHEGFVAGSAWPVIRPGFGGATWKPRAADFEWRAPSGGHTELVFRPDLALHDGRFANNGWLQELPDPMTKLTWDNAVLLNPVTAREMGVTQGDVLRLSRGGTTLEMPAYLMPGQARGSVTVALGYGRRAGGAVAVAEHPGRDGGGIDVYPLRTTDALWRVSGVEMTKTGARYALATTQDHHAIFNPEQGRGEAERLPELYREGTLAEYREEPEFAKHRVHHPPLVSLWTEHDYSTGHRWGMTIDLSACIGCSACVIACQAENNSPVVGKPEVGRGREMQWIRVDRYFAGGLEAPRAMHQPVTCQQCENAPCEQVCPVAATVHSHEGLNDMVYNRCVGTRYCLNNCPYKVRRFNWFNNSDQKYNSADLFKMQRNPDVTVRARGVMEKCTYCVQRIKAVTIPARNERRAVRDGEIVPACAQTCPTRAIEFGDLNDPESRVRKSQDHARSYAMLEELNVKPRTNYMAKIHNPVDGGGAHGGAEHHAGLGGTAGDGRRG